MGAYILRRVLLMIPTLFGIMAISFIVIQFAPGGPVEQVIAQLTDEIDAGKFAGADKAADAWQAKIYALPTRRPPDKSPSDKPADPPRARDGEEARAPERRQ